MKRLFFMLLGLMCIYAASARSINYYGVDFSKARTFGASETGTQFFQAFRNINQLTINEWEKYNIEKFAGRSATVRDISVTQAENKKIDPEKIETTSVEDAFTVVDMEAMVRGYKINEKEGTGLVILGGLLDRAAHQGTFVFVYFDIASRQILSYEAVTGKAGGFGLRNYWAGALYSALKTWSNTTAPFMSVTIKINTKP